MKFDFEKVLSDVNKKAKSSVIRELLALTNRPGMISFAGGLPDPHLFPIKSLEKSFKKIIKKSSHVALQYGPTGGLDEFKDIIIAKLKKEEKLSVTRDHILVTTASQQSLTIVGRCFVDDGDTVLVELPSYLGALQVFTACGARLEGVASDDDGIIVDELRKKIEQLQREGRKIKFLYLVPDFQNPSGVCLAGKRRQDLINVASEHGVLVIEDTPYREVRFEGKHLPLLYKLQKDGNVVSLFTFSKTLVPGFRLGYIVADPELIKKFSVFKQTLDLCTSPFSQMLAGEMLKGSDYPKHLQRITKVYKKKRDCMIAALEEYMPKHPELTWTHPHGGLFLWLRCPPSINTDKMFYQAVEKQVAFVIGSAFHCDGKGQNAMRLNFSFPTEKEIKIGIKRLAEAIKDAIAQAPSK